jgi:AcrR family transcriptional regulator
VPAAPSRAVPRSDTHEGEGTRERILHVALRLFAAHSFAGTSLQMIADELGITKAAVYHHFHTREDLLSALMTPALDEMRAAIQDAEAQRTPQARAEHMLTGFAGLAVRHRKLTAILSSDQAIARLIRAQAMFASLVERPLGLLAGAASDPAARINATLTLSGIASTAGNDLLTDLDDDTMRKHLVDTGRRILGLRAPRAHVVPRP